MRLRLIATPDYARDRLQCASDSITGFLTRGARPSC